MPRFKVLSPEEAEQILSKTFQILDSYDFDRFPEIFAEDLDYEGGLQSNKGLDDFTTYLSKQMKIMPGMKTSHSRTKNDVTEDGTIYSTGFSTALFDTHPDQPVTIPMLGVFTVLAEGPDAGKINTMRVYKDRIPFMPYIQAAIPGQGKK